MTTPGESFKKISSAGGEVMDAAKAKLAGLRQPATPPGIGAATSDALGPDASLRQQAAATKAQAEMGGAQVRTSREPFMGRAGPTPIPDAPPGISTGGINPSGPDLVRPAERIAAEGGTLRQAGVRTASPAEQAAAKSGGFFKKVGGLVKGAGYIGAGVAALDAVDKASAGQTSDQVAGRTTNPLLAGARELQDTLTFGQGRRMSDAAIAGGVAMFDDPGKNAGIFGRLRNAATQAGAAWSKTDAEEKAVGAPRAAPVTPAKPTGPNSTSMSGTIGVPETYQDLFSDGGTGGFAGPIAPNVAAQLRASAARVAGPKQYMDPKAVSGTPGYTTGTQPLPLDEDGLPPSGPFEQAAARRAMYGPGNLAVPAQGTGAFKRSSDGGVVTPAFSKPSEPTNVGSEVDQLARQGAAGIPGYGQQKSKYNAPLAGLARTTMQEYEARRAGRYADAQGLRNEEMSLKKQTASTAATAAATAAERQRQMDIRANKADDRAGRAADQTYEAAGKKELEDRVAADIEAANPPADDSLVSGAGTTRKNKVAQQTKVVMDRMESSAAQRKDGKKLGQLSPAEREQLVIGNKILEKTAKARDTWTQSMRDFFGNKRVDTKNIYSAMPQRADRDIGGGIRITMGNGNTATVEALEGGGFRIFGVNNPVDADIAELLKKPIDDLLKREAADQQKRKK